MMATDRQGSCADRIGQHMAGREETLRGLYEAINADDEDRAEEAREELDTLALGLSTKVLLRIDLSTGGPADYLTAVCERERFGLSVERVTYHFADWFDHAEQDVPEDSPLWQLRGGARRVRRARAVSAGLEALVCRDAGRELMRLSLEAFAQGDEVTGEALRRLSRREYSRAIALLLEASSEQEVAA